MKKGLIQVYTGDGKGKTTCAFGLALRASGRDFKTLIVQFLKPTDYESGEVLAVSKLSELITVKRFGDSTTWGKIKPKSDYDLLAREYCQQAWKELVDNTKDYNIVILDEIASAIKHNLVDLSQVLNFLENKPDEVEIVLTGRSMPKQIIDISDLVSEIKAVKHPFKRGIAARKGIEF